VNILNIQEEFEYFDVGSIPKRGKREENVR
jgi:hypothetical protein